MEFLCTTKNKEICATLPAPVNLMDPLFIVYKFILIKIADA